MSAGDQQTASNGVSAMVQSFIREIQEGIKADIPEKKDKVEIPEDYEEDPTTVNNWIQQMMLYFQEKEITNNWKKITIALPKIKKGKDNQAQQLADTFLGDLILFNEE
ncbi:hypothetical protein BDQ17DRAFT_1430449 [Cyathus striatus]|nr:hypothetical protein BDQ17DRAFT_1430449 [Cyathus striatus]